MNICEKESKSINTSYIWNKTCQVNIFQIFDIFHLPFDQLEYLPERTGLYYWLFKSGLLTLVGRPRAWSYFHEPRQIPDHAIPI